jgi:hypothetical protein
MMRWGQFEGTIGELLLRSEVCYAADGYCVALASFATPGTIDYLKRYLEFYLRRPDLWFDQDDAMAALCWLDQQQGSDYASPFLPLWSDFVANKPNWDLEGSKEAFARQMARLEQLRAVIR